MFSRKTLAVSCAICLAAAYATAAQDAPPAKPDKPAAKQEAKMATTAELKSGTVKQVDEATKMLTVKITTREGAPLAGSEAKDAVVCWDETTKIEGGPVKDGDLVHFKTADKGGKTCATWIHVGKLEKPKAN